MTTGTLPCVAGRMDAEGIVRWMQRRAGPRATLLQDTDTAAAFISSQDLVVIGFFKVGCGEWGLGRGRGCVCSRRGRTGPAGPGSPGVLRGGWRGGGRAVWSGRGS